MIPVVDLLRWPLQLVPDAVHTVALARLLTHLLRGQSLAQRLREVDGRTVCIHIVDTGSRFQFLVRDGCLRAASSAHADVTIRGDLEDFWRLASRAEDPDTLFFARRLCIEGDTDAGLHIKNLLDALDYDWVAHVRDVLPAPLATAAVHLGHALHAPARSLFQRLH